MDGDGEPFEPEVDRRVVEQGDGRRQQARDAPPSPHQHPSLNFAKLRDSTIAAEHAVDPLEPDHQQRPGVLERHLDGRRGFADRADRTFLARKRAGLVHWDPPVRRHPLADRREQRFDGTPLGGNDVDARTVRPDECAPAVIPPQSDRHLGPPHPYHGPVGLHQRDAFGGEVDDIRMPRSGHRIDPHALDSCPGAGGNRGEAFDRHRNLSWQREIGGWK